MSFEPRTWQPQPTRTLPPTTSLQGLAGLGSDVGISLPGGSSTPEEGVNFIQKLIGWITGGTGQLKEAATMKAERYVRQMYGLEGSCELPPPGLPIIPKKTPPTFCATSIAGMIERCQVTAAETTFNFLKQSMVLAAGKDPLFNNWYQQYGLDDISHLSGVIASAKSVCGLTSYLPSFWPGGFNASGMPITSTGGGSGSGGGTVPGPGSGLSSETITYIAIGLGAMFLLPQLLGGKKRR